MISVAPFINHLLAREDWALQQLLPHAGKVACIDTQMLQIRLRIAVDGYLEAVAPDASADVTIRIQASDVPLILQNRERAFSYVKIEGDADLANTISRLSEHLRWDAEADLSRVIGDIPAVHLVAGSKSLIANVQQAHQRLQHNLAEYLTEEKPVLVRPQLTRQLSQQVQQTRDDVERLMKRIERLERLRS